MEPWEDLYSLLQIHPQAEKDMLQSAYRRLCKKYHPDVNPSPSAKIMMRRINAAYEILSDDNARRDYHARWLRRNPAMGGPAPAAEVRERVVYVNRPPADASGGTPAAAEVVRLYFDHLGANRYRDAFALVSARDKQCFSYGAYVEWQESVSALYEVGRTRLRLFRRYGDLKIHPGVPTPAEEYTVTIAEKDRTTGEISEYSMSKYAVREFGLWKVYLGYRDLTPLKMQFKAMASNPAEVQFLGLWERHCETHDLALGLPNRVGFERAAEREIYRNARYGRPFSIAAISVGLPPQLREEAQRERLLKFVGYVISQAARAIDSTAYLGEGLFGVLLAETDGEAAPSAARRLLQTARHDVAACFDFDVPLRAGLASYTGAPLQDMLEACLKTMGGAAVSREERKCR